MADSLHQRARELFDEIVALGPLRREARLDLVRREDPDLSARVEELLRRHDLGPVEARTEAAPSCASPGGSASPEELLPMIDRYRLVRLIGAGGMGTVYEAEQLEPVRRFVAVKVLERGLDTEQITRRFAAERQTLARLDHPGIARVLDAGQTRECRPFFAMELVHGEPITDFANAARLGVRSRLLLFVDACGAVQHAHQRGILHRDLKPSNVLVESLDDENVVKIIDFGIAKALEPEEGTQATSVGQMLGTPDYMSPEQARGSSDIDTRADVFSLGVLLYQLLTDALPWSGESAPDSPIALARATLGRETLRPSVRLSRLDEAATGIAEARGTDRTSLLRALRGELDWICMKAIDNDRERRYDSPSELARDVGRHLAGEPVLAGPPTVRYRAGKFVARHRWAVGAVATLALAVVLGLAGTTAGMIRATRAETAARQEARTSGEVVQFLVDVFRSSDPYAQQPSLPSTRELLDRASERIGDRLGDDPAVRSALLGAMGQVYSRLGLPDEAEPLLRESLEVLESLPEAKPRQVAGGSLRLAELLHQRGRLAEAEPLLRAVLELLGPVGETPEDVLDLAAAHVQLGILMRDRGELEPARDHLERSLALREEELGNDDGSVAHALYHLGWLEYLSGSPAAAEERYRRALAIWERSLGPAHASVGWVHNDLGVVLGERGELESALEHYQRAIEIHQARLGDQHPALAAPLQNLGNLLADLGRYEEAVASIERSVAIREAALGPEHPDVAGSLDALAFQLRRLGRHDEARTHLERALRITAATVGENHPNFASMLNNLGSLERDSHRFDQARAAMERALEIQSTTLPELHPKIAGTLSNLASLDFEVGDHAAAAMRLERALEIRADDPLASALTHCRLGRAYEGDGRSTDAAVAVAKAMAIVDGLDVDALGTRRILLDCRLLGARIDAGGDGARRARAALSLVAAELEASPELIYGGLQVARARVHARLGETGTALDLLASAVAAGTRADDLMDLRDLEELRGVRDDPRFAQLVQRAGRQD
ncbi:MAG: serine/threonine protein kinase [Acidobacteria bacterium]|nr:MAG: serine/threonine protein kinase [Acidobacteriota bacterium]REK09343.1 MAG: serine/threonine protein kinase [Acidobacteriota bacterium]